MRASAFGARMSRRPRPARLMGAALAALLLPVAAAGCRSAPRADIASTVRPLPPQPVARPEVDNYGRLLLPEGSTVQVEGDDLAYGAASDDAGKGEALNGAKIPRLSQTWPVLLSKLLGGRVRVVQAVYPGDKATDGLARWSQAGPADLTVIQYGANEYLDEDGRVPPEDYAAALRALADRARAHGGWVMLLTPPPYRGAAVNGGLEPYRNVVRAFRGEPRLLVVELPPALLNTPGFWADKRRLGRAGQQAVAGAVAGRILVTSRPSTG